MHACMHMSSLLFVCAWVMDGCLDAYMYIYIIHVYSCVHVHLRTHRSLTTLGRVVALLAEGQQNALPWRESKLTRLLQHSLGTTVALSNTCSCIYACMHVCVYCVCMHACMHVHGNLFYMCVNACPCILQVRRL